MSAPLLDDRLRALSEALGDAQPPESVDRAIAAAIASGERRARRSAGPRPFERWLAWPLALAASIFAISLIVRYVAPGDAIPASTEATLREAARAFLPLASNEEIERARDAYVVPARLPRTALAQFGLPVNPQRIDEAVDTELLVRTDGAVLAVRFVD